MKRIYLFASLLLCSMGFVLTGCSDDDLSSTSVFAGDTIKANGEFDKWLTKNYLETYNIDFQYRYNDKLTDQVYNVIPADVDVVVTRDDGAKANDAVNTLISPRHWLSS